MTEIKTHPPEPPVHWTIEPTRSAELGAKVSAEGVTFGVYSAHAHRIRVLLFREGEKNPFADLALPSCHGHVFQGFIPGLKPGALYGLRAEGPFDPWQGQRFNPNRLLIDPYTRALHGSFRQPERMLAAHIRGHNPGEGEGDLFLDSTPNDEFMPKCVVVESRFDWQGDVSPGIPHDKMILYEAHVKGFTAHPSSGVAAPGTFLGFMEKIPHLQSLGVNAIELLPVQAKYSEEFLTAKGLSNYWGYNTAAFFALEPGYGSLSRPGCEIEEFKTLVRELHRAGIEVILDVVYNHSAEGSESGPTLSLRGLDNSSYYSLMGPEEEPLRHYRNYTGCGNTLDFGRPVVTRLTLDSLRYFVEEFHVDGFRFDLAKVLGRRGKKPFNPAAPFFTAAAQDPVLRRIKFIAEPWDVEAYALGRFPDGWLEWNDGFRDITRRWVRGDDEASAGLRDKLEGSPDIYEKAGREPWSSLNFSTCHDGFTLRDWVSYDHKHNLANGESNRDGNNNNLSWNCGHEGEGGGIEVERLRQRQARNLLMLTALARGTPMFLGGDEFLRTQWGNNNAYCQDNSISWLDWNHVRTQAGFLRFFREILGWRNKLSLLNTWESIPNRAWGRCWQGWSADGNPWPDNHPLPNRCSAFLLHKASEKPFPDLLKLKGSDIPFYLILNSADTEMPFLLPALPKGWHWTRIVDTSLDSPDDIVSAESGTPVPWGFQYPAAARSSVLLRALIANPISNPITNPITG